MERASKAIRRSGVRLKALGGGHGDLSMVISELKDVRQAAKMFMQAQSTTSQDMLKWSLSDENRAIQDCVSQLAELNSLWTEVQKEFTEQLKDYKYQFEMILEGERHVDQARNHLTACEQRELKIKKELKKAAKHKATQEEMKQLEIKLAQAERAKDLAQLEVVDRIRENESLKMVRFKEGLMKISEAYVELATKCAIIFGAQQDIACQLPDVTEQDLHEIKYTGSGLTKLAVMKAKDRVRRYRRRSHLLQHSHPLDPPPPYTPSYFNDMRGDGTYNLDDVIPMSGDAGNNFFDCERRHILNVTPSRQRVLADHPLPQRPLPAAEGDIRWNEDYEDDLSGAMGGTRIE